MAWKGPMEINPDTYGQFIFNKEARTWQKDRVFSKWCWGNRTAACKPMKLEHTLTPSTKINSTWLKDLNIAEVTIKLLEDNIGKTSTMQMFP